MVTWTVYSSETIYAAQSRTCELGPYEQHLFQGDKKAIRTSHVVWPGGKEMALYVLELS